MPRDRAPGRVRSPLDVKLGTIVGRCFPRHRAPRGRQCHTGDDITTQPGDTVCQQPTGRRDAPKPTPSIPALCGRHNAGQVSTGSNNSTVRSIGLGSHILIVPRNARDNLDQGSRSPPPAVMTSAAECAEIAARHACSKVNMMAIRVGPMNRPRKPKAIKPPKTPGWLTTSASQCQTRSAMA